MFFNGAEESNIWKETPEKKHKALTSTPKGDKKHVVHFLQMLSHPSINIKYSKFLSGQSRLNYKRKKNIVAIT